MFSDNDFVNAFINKQSDTLKDMLNKNIMLEVKLGLTEKALQEVTQERDKLKEELSILKPEVAPRPNSPEGKEFERKRSKLLSGVDET